MICEQRSLYKINEQRSKLLQRGDMEKDGARGQSRTGTGISPRGILSPYKSTSCNSPQQITTIKSIA
jgi:hypothetical protein